MLPRQYLMEQDSRKRQIDTLKIFNDNVTEVKENTEYKVEFNINGSNYSLNVVLPLDFPNEKPNIFINPVFPHPWFADNSNKVVAAPGLVHYTMHSDLGRVVQAIIREFQRVVPMMGREDMPIDARPQSSLLADLGNLTVHELQEILENPDLQDKLLESDPQLIELDLETEEIMENIEQIARDNIIKQHMLDHLKSELLERISTIVQMKMNYEELNKKHQKMSEMYDPHRIKDCLKTAAVKADEDAEIIAEQFLLGKISVDAFISKFAEKRAQGQARRAKEERLSHQLAQLDKATT